MDRFTWGFVIGALLLCAAGAGTVFIARATPPPPLSTPAGVVTAYLQGVRDRDADRAWDLLAPGASIGPAPPSAVAAASSRDTFRQQLASMGSGPSSASRIRIIDATERGDTARVDI
ncbi:MAG TPA: hypothetical protein VK821_19375, partial [Dehalococcoidia bacterium]|nr:hypothetical protein [Dehalococcoidia bacterium]